jgi:sigma-B regulation protein RsbU (phosphoserine phosphatase)
VFSLDRDAVVGKSVHDLFPPDVANRLVGNERQVIESKVTVTTQEVVPHPDGDHIYVSVKCPLFDTAGQVTAVAGISTDFTEQVRARQAEEELRLARSFQRKLYPSRAPTVAGLDVAGAAVPVMQMCGDYFDYVPFDERRLAVSLGDVSGHGLGPALEMVEIRTASRFLLGRGMGLADTLHELNQMLCDDLPESSFVSLFLAEVDVGGNRLNYLGAGHDAFLIRVTGEATWLDSTHSLLGIDRSLTFSDVASVPMRPGDLLFLFTDGLTDAMSVTGEPFGRRRATQVVSRHREEPAEQILRALYLAVYVYTWGRSPADDMTAIVVKLVGPG